MADYPWSEELRRAILAGALNGELSVDLIEVELFQGLDGTVAQSGPPPHARIAKMIVEHAAKYREAPPPPVADELMARVCAGLKDSEAKLVKDEWAWVRAQAWDETWPEWGGTAWLADQLQQAVAWRRMVIQLEKAQDAALRGPAALDDIKELIQKALTAADTGWPDPEPLPDTLPPVPPFDATAMLPKVFARWVTDVSQRQGSPVDFVGVGLVVAAASVIGRKLVIRPKRKDDWKVTPNNYGALIGPPGALKSPALKAAVQPVAWLEAKARKPSTGGQGTQDVMAKEREKVLLSRLRAAMKASSPTEAIERDLAALRASTAPRTPRRFMVNDCTIEKLNMLLEESPLGLLQWRDELMSTFKSLEKPGREADRAFLLEAWAGDAPTPTDRVTRPSTYVPATCVSLLGGIQPSALGPYLRAAFSGAQDDGLIPRFQLATYPDIPEGWTAVDRTPDNEAKAAVMSAFQALASLTPSVVGAEAGDEDDPPFLRFSTGAQPLFDAWYEQLMSKKVRDPDTHPVVQGHLAKYAKTMPGIALTLHLIESLTRPSPAMTRGVSEDATRMAIVWMEYLEPHARRMYDSLTSRGRATAALLGAKLRAGAFPGPFRVRDIKRKGWAGLSDAADDSLLPALDILEAAGWLRARHVRGPEGGRPTTEWRVNPKVLA